VADENQPPNNAASETAAITLDTIKGAGIPDSYLKDGAYDFTAIASGLTEAAALKTQAEERSKLVPASADKYDLTLPKDIALPEGLNFNTDTPFAKEFIAWAHKTNLTQADVTGALAMRARLQIAEHAESQKFVKDEMAKLGNGVEQRLGTLFNSLKGAVGEAGAKEVAGALTTAASVQAVEKLISLAGGPKLAAKVDGGGDNKPDLSNMSARQKLDYANAQAHAKAKH